MPSDAEYYEILGITSDASIADVKRAFRRLALQYHPDKNPSPNAAKKFRLIKAAEEYLIGKLERHQAFGTNKPPPRPRSPPFRKPDPPVMHTLIVSLEDILHGTTKKVRLTRKIVSYSGRTSKETKDFSVRINRGTINGHRIVFPLEGDRRPDHIPADIIFVVQEKAHKYFKRHKDVHLLYTASISYENFISPTFLLEIPSLEGEIIHKRVSSKAEFRIYGRGLPYFSTPSKRGDIIVRLNIAKPLPKDPPVEHQIYVTLEEVFCGTTKTFKITRKVIDFYGREKIEVKQLLVVIKKGIKDGTRIDFKEEGDRKHGSIPGDIIFIVHLKPHLTFQRLNEADLLYEVSVTYKQSVTPSFRLYIPTLEGEKITKRIVNIKSLPEFRIPGRGLPQEAFRKLRGDLIVRLLIKKGPSSNTFHGGPKAFQGRPTDSFKPRDPPVEYGLSVSLEDIFNGVTKRMKITQKMTESPNRYKTVEISVKIKPGTTAGTRIAYLGEAIFGDSFLAPVDIVFIVEDKPHDVFRRLDDYDLLYTVPDAHKHAITFKLQVPTLDGAPVTELLTRSNSSVLKNGYRQWRIFGFGLPKGSNCRNRGDIVIRQKL